jgi:hypothetical protein
VRNVLGLALILLGIFLIFIPTRVQDETVTSLPAINHPDLSVQEITSEQRQRDKSEVSRSYARSRLSGNEFHYFDQLVYLESRWDNEAQNPYSTAYGLGQFLDQTWETVGYEKTDDPHTQIDAMIEYVTKRYGSFEAALTAWYERAERTGHGWY